jgi:hypothetical protein
VRICDHAFDSAQEYPSILAEYAAFLSSNIGEEGVEKVDDIFGFLTENAIIDEYGASAYVKHLGRTGRHAKAVAVMENLTASEQFGSEAWTHAVRAAFISDYLPQHKPTHGRFSSSFSESLKSRRRPRCRGNALC